MNIQTIGKSQEDPPEHRVQTQRDVKCERSIRRHREDGILGRQHVSEETEKEGYSMYSTNQDTEQESQFKN